MLQDLLPHLEIVHSQYSQTLKQEAFAEAFYTFGPIVLPGICQVLTNIREKTLSAYQIHHAPVENDHSSKHPS